MKTKSEELFEEYCQSLKIPFQKIHEGETKSPDYMVEIDGTLLIVEIKQFDPNDEDKASLLELRKAGACSTNSEPGKRARNKLNKASKQLSRLCRGKYPGVVVLFNNIITTNPADSYHIKTAMYGLDTIVMSVPDNLNETPMVIERKSGPKRKMTPNNNTSISAVAVLDVTEDGPLLSVYHNRYSAIPLSEKVFGKLGCRQFRVEKGDDMDFERWCEIR